MSGPLLYRAYGLLISSDLDLGLRQAPSGEPDIVLRRGSDAELADAPLDREDPSIVATYDGPRGRWYVAFDDGETYRLRFRDCGEFSLSKDFRTIRWMTAGARAHLLPILFVGTVLALVLTMQGRLVLHASAVARERRALAFVGQSGRGKTTLAALTAASGARLVTDDVLLVDVEDRVRCRGHAGELRLRDAARPLAAAFTDDVQRREMADRRLALLTADVEPGWVDLGAIVVPRPSRETGQVEVRALPPSEAVLWLLAFPRVHGIRLHRVVQAQFEGLAEVARQVPVYDVTVPWGPPFGPGIADELLTLADCELAERQPVVIPSLAGNT